MKNYRKVYAIRDIESGLIVSRYTKNGFYSRRGDAVSKCEQDNKYQMKHGRGRNGDPGPFFEVVESDIVWRKSEEPK